MISEGGNGVDLTGGADSVKKASGAGFAVCFVVDVEVVTVNLLFAAV